MSSELSENQIQDIIKGYVRDVLEEDEQERVMSEIPVPDHVHNEEIMGYHQRVTHGSGLPELMVIFNHSSQKQTLDYLCVQPEEVKDIYLNEL